MTRFVASLALLLCTMVGGCAADQSGATSPQADQGYTPIGSNIPRRTAVKPEQPAAKSASPL